MILDTYYLQPCHLHHINSFLLCFSSFPKNQSPHIFLSLSPYSINQTLPLSPSSLRPIKLHQHSTTTFSSPLISTKPNSTYISVLLTSPHTSITVFFPSSSPPNQTALSLSHLSIYPSLDSLFSITV